MNKKKAEQDLNLNFSFIQSFYWMAYCSTGGFASVFLLSKDFDNRQVGLVLALANIFAVFLQPMVASLADSSKHVTIKQLVCILSFMALSFSAVLIFIPDSFIIIASLFVLIFTSIIIMQPLINGLVFEFVNNGIFVNFGVTRGIGSVAYALISYFLGVLVERLGPVAIPYVSFLLILGLFICLFMVKDLRKLAVKKDEKRKRVDKKNAGNNAKLSDFIRDYKRFLGYLLGILLIFTYHTMFNNYLIHVVTRLGGTSKSMGLAIFIAAVLELPVMGLFTIMVKKTGIRKLLFVSAFFFVLKAIGALIATNMGMLYVDQMLQIFAYAIMIPASVNYINIVMKEKDRVKGQAYTTSAMTAGAVIGNLLGGTLIDVYGVFSMLWISVVFATAGFVCILIFTEKEGGLGYEKA